MSYSALAVAAAAAVVGGQSTQVVAAAGGESMRIHQDTPEGPCTWSAEASTFAGPVAIWALRIETAAEETPHSTSSEAATTLLRSWC